jgi:hypothetical protein
VDFRDRFAEELEGATEFKMTVKTEVKKKADGTTETIETPAESEVQYVNRFRKAVLEGTFTHPRFPKDSLEDALQSFADTLGAFQADAKRPERVAKPKTPPKWIMERVVTIFNNGTQARWWDVMAKESIKINPLTGDKEKDKISLAWAIRERENRRELEEAKQYA